MRISLKKSIIGSTTYLILRSDENSVIRFLDRRRTPLNNFALGDSILHPAIRSDEISLIRLDPNQPGVPLSMRRDLLNVFGFLSPGHLQADLMDLLNACDVQSTGFLIVDLTRSL